MSLLTVVSSIMPIPTLPYTSQSLASRMPVSMVSKTQRVAHVQQHNISQPHTSSIAACYILAHMPS